jgi:pyruvate dehydrogenase E2 component (dihydrolipoamide acetyltransferase)
MADVILMPRLSDTITEGVIAAWHKKVGDTVNKGDLLAEIETDKTTMELDSYQTGVLLHIGAPAGGKLQVNDLLAILGKPGEDVSALVAQHTPGTALQAAPSTAPASVPAAAQPAVAPSVDVSKMEEVVLMPRLSDTMTEGVIAAWHKNIGDTVKKGEILADIETDKATMVLESYKDGTLLYQGAKAGEKIQVNDLLCIIGKEGLDVNGIVAALKNGAPAAAGNAPAPATTAPVPTQANNTAPAATPTVVYEG